MNRIDIKDNPANASNYELEDGRIVRVHLRLLTPDSELAKAEFIDVETVAYEITKSGAFVVDDNGEPITLPKQRTRIPLANVRAGADSMKPGWTRQDLSYDPKNPRDDVADVKQLKALPKSGKSGDRVYVEADKSTYVYTDGLYETVRHSRVAEMLSIVPIAVVQTLTADQLKDLRP